MVYGETAELLFFILFNVSPMSQGSYFLNILD